MDTKFYKIYDELYRSSRAFSFRNRVWWLRRGGFPFLVDTGWIRETIDRADEKFGGQLRTDAKYFLLSNFSNMIILPLSHPESPRRAEEAELRSAVSQDVETIVALASSQRNGDQTTAADIVRAASETLEKLQVNSFRFWGPKVRDGE